MASKDNYQKVGIVGLLLSVGGLKGNEYLSFFSYIAKSSAYNNSFWIAKMALYFFGISYFFFLFFMLIAAYTALKNETYFNKVLMLGILCFFISQTITMALGFNVLIDQKVIGPR